MQSKFSSLNTCWRFSVPSYTGVRCLLNVTVCIQWVFWYYEYVLSHTGVKTCSCNTEGWWGNRLIVTSIAKTGRNTLSIQCGFSLKIITLLMCDKVTYGGLSAFSQLRPACIKFDVMCDRYFEIITRCSDGLLLFWGVSWFWIFLKKPLVINTNIKLLVFFFFLSFFFFA